MDYEKSIPIWNNLYELHWDYIQTEENSTDLLSKKDILKECIKEFLINSLPDRKFYLPQTVEVLKGSVHKLNHFSAYEASIAFDAIAQYANNLLTKPWRKEYKVIKTHSGFYQHKIKSQLVDVDEMFIAMGYVKSQNQTLVFNGSICQDQLANVSRDCMIACEECLIMHRIYYSLQNFNVNVSWVEVYRYRELNTGDEQQSIFHFRQKKQKENMLTENIINQVPPLRCNCNIVHAMPQPPYQPCQYNYQSIPSNGCMNHAQVTHFNCYQPHYDHSSHLPHSRSMDQYTTDHGPIRHELFRHSLDHSMVNDTVDGHQRYVKPIVPINNIIHQQTPSTSSFYNSHLNHYNGGSEYALSSNSNRPTNANYSSNKISPRNYDQQFKHDNHLNISCYPPKHTYEEDLIKFEDSPKNAGIADRNYVYQDQSYDNHYTEQLRKADNSINRQRQSYSYANAVKQSQHFDNTQQHLMEQKLREMDISNGEPKKSSKDLRNNDRNFERIAKNRRILAELETDDQNSRDSRASDFDSAEYMYDEENAKASRNKDGQGSVEEWSYVYNGIKKNGNYDDGLRNGNDRVNESKQKCVVKRSKDPRSEPSALTKSTPVSKDYKTNKMHKLRLSKIDVDELDLHKKPHKNGKNIDKSSKTPVSVSEWDCEHCTFTNTGTLKICSMCSKSRDFKDKPLLKSTATSV